MKDDAIIDPVQELGTEVVAELVQNRILHPFRSISAE